MWISMTTCNRYDYTVRTLESFAKTDFPENTHLVIKDDISTDEKVIEYLKEFSKRQINNLFIELIINPYQLQCDPNMVEGLIYCTKQTKDEYVITLDNDTIFNPQWLKKMIDIKDKLIQLNQKVGALTVFNTKTHKFLEPFDYEVGIKKDIGGFAAMINRIIFEKYNFYKPKWKLGWDWNMSWGLQEMGYKIFSTYKSYVEHIGRIGEHSDGKTRLGDYATDFIGE